jgi:hypothetical protein
VVEEAQACMFYTVNITHPIIWWAGIRASIPFEQRWNPKSRKSARSFDELRAGGAQVSAQNRGANLGHRVCVRKYYGSRSREP